MKKEQPVRFIKLGNLAKNGEGTTSGSEMLIINKQYWPQLCDKSEDSDDDLLLCERSVLKWRQVSFNASVGSTASCVSSNSLCEKSIKLKQNLTPVISKPIIRVIQPGTSPQLRFQNGNNAYSVCDHRIKGHASTISDWEQFSADSENDDAAGSNYSNDQSTLSVNCTLIDKSAGEQNDEQMQESNQADSITNGICDQYYAVSGNDDLVGAKYCNDKSMIQVNCAWTDKKASQTNDELMQESGQSGSITLSTAKAITEKEHQLMFEINNNGMNKVHLIKDIKTEVGTLSERENLQENVPNEVIYASCPSEETKNNSVHSEKHLTSSTSHSPGLVIKKEQRTYSVLGLAEVSNEKLFMELKQRRLFFLCVCGASFLGEQLYRDHKLCHVVAAPMVCAYCCQEFSDGFHFNKHLIQHLCKH